VYRVIKVHHFGSVPDQIYTGADVDAKYYEHASALLWSGRGIRDCDVNVSEPVEAHSSCDLWKL
jgi:hypothetical protein